MATFPGVELISNFSAIFTMLFVFALMYGVLSVTKVLGDAGKTLNPLVSILVAIMMLFSETVINIVEGIAPWFVLAIFVLFIILVLLRFLGVADTKDWGDFYSKNPQGRTVIYIVLVAVVLIIAFVVSMEVGQQVGPYLGEGNETTTSSPSSTSGGTTTVMGEEVEVGDVSSDDFSANFGATIFHPKVLGLVLMLLIGSFTVRFIAKDKDF